MTDTGYLHLRGYCFGNTLKRLAISHAHCGSKCDQYDQCGGYVYRFSDTRPFRANACVLKKKMCGAPVIIQGQNIYSYFPMAIVGKSLYVRGKYMQLVLSILYLYDICYHCALMT